MEDLEERRRRLAAMREQADSLCDDLDIGPLPSTRAPPFPSNPLEDSADVAAAEDEGHSFDYYTDPLAGFSGSKRRRPGVAVLPKPSEASQSSNASSKTSVSVMYPPSYLQPSSVYPPMGASSWGPLEYQPPATHSAFAHPHRPIQFHPHIPPHLMNQSFNQTSHQFFSQTSGSGRGRGRDGGFIGRYNGRQYPMGPAFRGDLSGRGYPPSSPGVGRGHVPNDAGGRGYLWLRGSPSGKSWRNGNRSDGRGAHERGQRGGRIVSAKEQPQFFAKKSMLEDPWLGLETSLMERT